MIQGLLRDACAHFDQAPHGSHVTQVRLAAGTWAALATELTYSVVARANGVMCVNVDDIPAILDMSVPEGHVEIDGISGTRETIPLIQEVLHVQ